MSAKMIPLHLVLCALALLTIPAQAQSPAGAGRGFRSGEIVVEVKPGASIDAVNERHRTTTIQRIYGTNFFRLRTPHDKSEERWRRRVARDRDVLSASLNPMVTSPTSLFARATVAFPGDRATPSRPGSEYSFQPDLFRLLSLHDAQLRSRGAGVVVAIIDTGIDRSHPALASRLWKDDRQDGDVEADQSDQDHDGLLDDASGWDFVDDDNDPSETAQDPHVSVAGHGTFIAGLIALIAPECRIMPIRAFTPDGISNAFTVAAAIKYAVDHGASVINLSFGSPKKSGVVRDALRYARQRGAILIAAMGNEGQDTDSNPQYPAISRDVIGVAALNADSRKATFSNFGSDVRVSALGVDLISTYPGADGKRENYAMWSGTSFAAPLTAAEAALILADSPGENARRTIEQTADAIDHLNPDFSGKLGKGRINPLAALENLYSATAPAGNYANLTLIAESGAATAQGQAETLITGPLQQFRIAARGLTARARYTLIINGKNIRPNGFTATNFGGLVIELSSEPTSPTASGHIRLELPPELNPVTNLKTIELRDGAQVVLRGEFIPITGGAGREGQFLVKRTPLASTGIIPQAAGKANIFIGTHRQEIKVEGNRLMPGETYRVFADGIEIGTAAAQSATTKSGFLRIRLVGSEAIPPSLRPLTNIRHIEVRDSSDQIILQGDFLPGGDGSEGR
ncbi:MAG TPA: S8 family serine peptidase [Blastocatellia bacterium]|nr:S8 family serine peptidase [Blastocatellia bacterium]